MTAAELIEALQALPQDLEVVFPENYDYARVVSVRLVRIAPQRADFIGAGGEPVAVVALNFDPVDLMPQPESQFAATK